jgi:multidrug efflux pump
VSYKNGAAVRLSDVAEVSDSVQDLRNAGSANGKPSVLVILFRQPGANIIETVDRVNKLLPDLRSFIPWAIDLEVMMDRTPSIRASLRDVEHTLVISVGLVILVVFLFLRNVRATTIPVVAVPVSLIGTLAVMYLCGYSLNNLSLMALTIATGFVVDDAIVVLENISRYIEKGERPMQAALKGVREVGFTVISMSISLVAVFIPILMMGGIVGRLFHEFAVTLSAAIMVSLLLSLTVTPMMCARILKQETKHKPGGIYEKSERIFESLLQNYEKSLRWALAHSRFMMILLFITVGLNIYLFIVIPKGFFPQQDVGRLSGSIQADQSISFQSMRDKLSDFIAIVKQDPAVENVVGFTGGGRSNSGQMFISLKPLSERKISADEVIKRLRGKLAREPGARLLLQAQQDVRIGGRQSQAQYQYTIQADDLDELRRWVPKIYEAMKQLPMLADVNTDQQDNGMQTSITYDRDTIARLGITTSQINQVLNDAYGQRQVSTIYNPLNQYHVVMEVAPEYAQGPEALDSTYVVTADGRQIPFSAFSSYGPTSTPLSVNHHGQFAAATISFNLPTGVSLSTASEAINEVIAKLGVPESVHGSFQGTARAFQQSFNSMGWTLLAAIVTIYIILGILYESYIHPLTILSTLFPAGVGALLALKMFNTDFTIVAGIGILLLIGIVKKNAIMMIDFAIVEEREHKANPADAIFKACILRFRPIMMTTMAAILGALPLALGSGDGAELRQPLGISIVGGLIVSQMLTLYTTPIVYLYMDNFRIWCLRQRSKFSFYKSREAIYE